MMQALPQFEDLVLKAPATQGIKYAGSKLKMLPHILRLARKVDAKTVLDGFSGTTRVSQAFAKCGYTVVCNDVAEWSRVFATCYLLNRKSPNEYQALIDHLNSVPPSDGWFTEHYGGYSDDDLSTRKDGQKKPWQIHNTRKLDSIRQEIELLKLDDVERAVAITSLILALDQVDSTIGHYASYLRNWSQRSYNNLFLKVPEIFISSDKHEVYQSDVFDIASDLPVDLAYYDPPYGSNNDKMPPSRVRYSAYYHLWTSVCRFDNPKLFGKANRRYDSSDTISASPFEEFRRSSNGRFIAVETIENLIEATQARWIILSYSSGGRATAKELDEVLRSYGTLIEAIEIDYKKNVMSGMTWTHEWIKESEHPNREFLFLLEK